MEHFIGIDVSLASAAVCVLDARGGVVKEAKLPSEPEALTAFVLGRRRLTLGSPRMLADRRGRRR